MQHVCPNPDKPDCHGPTFPQTAPYGNSAVHERMCRGCGFQYTFDPSNLDEEKTGADFHLKAHQEISEAQAEEVLEDIEEVLEEAGYDVVAEDEVLEILGLDIEGEED